MTDKDKKLILEWCGFKQVKIEYHPVRYEKPVPTYKQIEWECPDGIRRISPPDLDSNFYFKYAVPKLVKIFNPYFCHIGFTYLEDKCESHIKTHQDTPIDAKREYYSGWKSNPAEAFGQALLKLIKEKENAKG